MKQLPMVYGRWSVAFLLALAAPASSMDLYPSVEIQPGTIGLSESTRLTLALEGPAPLQVEMPDNLEQLLAPEVAAQWRIRPAGQAKIEKLAEGRERWSRSFRLDPYAAGELVPLKFASIKGRAGKDLIPADTTWPSKDVRVLTEIAEVKADAARPATGIEDLPPATSPRPEETVWLVAAGLLGIFLSAIAAALIRRWRAKPLPLPPKEWTTRELDRLGRQLAAGQLSGADAVGRTAAVLRVYVERQHLLPAPKMTTAELLDECARADWSSERMVPLREILEDCDRAKFAGTDLDSASASDILTRASEWILAST